MERRIRFVVRINKDQGHFSNLSEIGIISEKDHNVDLITISVATIKVMKFHKYCMEHNLDVVE